MLAIRLRRIGKRSHPTFQFVVSEKARTPKSSVLEFLGSYDPHTNPATVKVNGDRIKHWLGHGAQPSATVHNLLVDAGVITTPKVKVASAPKKEEPKVEAAPAAAAPEATPAEAPPAA
ncbi:MAG: 30S ribosomal protein S16 [Candidatus Kerfeldbacteria bacterium]|nr:30S ribosomal protein S16 [Candidatus Kerfeldbacteria bacterium]